MGKRWVAAAALIVVVGIMGSAFAARAVSGNEDDVSRGRFEASSREVASTLQLALQREEDLVVSASAFILGNPNGTNEEFIEWTNAVRVAERFPELQLFGLAVIVPADELADFGDQALPDANGQREPGPLAIVPPGDRPYYCLGRLLQLRNPELRTPAGFDFCATPLGPAFLAARDSGLGSYFPHELGEEDLLAIHTPIYVGGVVPTTTEARRAAFAGLVGTVVDPKVVLDRAAQGHPGITVSMGYDKGGSKVVLLSGAIPQAAEIVTIDLHNGWTVTTFGTPAVGGAFANGNSTALVVLLGGIALTLLLALLVFVLGTGRARALRLVGERTGELRHQALHDELTGLPNRVLIMDRIEQLLARNRRYGTDGAVLYVDLDEFKNVNDTLGHEAGDRLLIAAAARLESTLRGADTIGRMGGDEFVVLIDGASLEVSPELVAERLLDVMRQPFELEGSAMPLLVNASIGIAMGDRDSGGELLRDADVALYEAKAAGKNRYQIFFPEMQTTLSRRIELEFDLRSALNDHQFRLVYQPIYNLDDLTLVGVEALLRWDNPTLGLVEPDDFIPILERTGQIREVGRWVLAHACRQVAAWHDSGDMFDVSVNVSGRQLDDDAIVDDIREAIEASGLEATRLIIEITETALMRNADVTAMRLQQIKDLGVRIAVDDFGTGYSSLAYLRQFPVDCLKIDRSFTNAIGTSPESKALVRTLVQLGKDLGLKTLAEGVETTDELDSLRSENVNEAQGFLLSRPLDPDSFEAQLLAPTREQPAVDVDI